MTETLETPEPSTAETGTDLASVFQQWEETPPPSLSEALTERGIAVDAIEEYTRSGIGTDETERLRRVLVQGATSENPEDGALLARLTPLLDPRERAWERVVKAKNSGEVLTATVTEAVKGGVVVDLGVRGFVPSSQIGLSVPRNLTQYIGRPLKLRVKEVDRRRQTVILSNREIAEEERAEKRRGAISRLEEGQERTGVVRRITEIGAFVDVGGVDGLLHVSEIAWKRIDKPSDILSVGEKIQVKVLRVDPQAGRISLSMRRLTQDPWEEIRRKYQDGSTHTVKVARTIAQGAIIELEGGMEGFLPISELASRRVATVEEVVQPGGEIEAMVIDIVPRDRRVVFSVRKMEQRRERQVVDNYQKKARTTAAAPTNRTTLGDLFGHLFEEYQPEPEPAPKPEPVAAAEPVVEPVAEPAVGLAADIEELEVPLAAVEEVAADEAGTDEAVVPETAIGDEVPAVDPEIVDETLADQTPTDTAVEEAAVDDVSADEPPADSLIEEAPEKELAAEVSTEETSSEESSTATSANGEDESPV